MSMWDCTQMNEEKYMQMKCELLMGNLNKCKAPYLSIVIPTYGRTDSLEQAVESAITQKSERYICEVIVVSNDPTDSLEKLITKYQSADNLYIYRNKENIGMVGNSNRCAELARGKYIAFLHDDDYLLKNYLSIVEKYFFDTKTDSKCFIPARYLLFEEKDKSYRNALIKNRIRKFYFLPNLYRKKTRRMKVKYNLYANFNCYFSPSCGTVFEKDAFEHMGGFDLSIPFAWDYDFYLRFNIKYNITVCTRGCAVYRIGSNASLRSDVKFDFFEYNRTKYIEFMQDNRIGNRFIDKYKNEIIYSVFDQYADDLKKALLIRNQEIPVITNKFKWYWFKFRTLLYYYNNNLDIQRLIPKKYQ